MRQAIAKWEESMPEQVDDILDTGKIHCLTGDITQPGLGLSPSELEMLQDEATVVIHSAANFSVFQALPESVRDNSLPVMELGRMLCAFRKLKFLLHISSISSQSFLPGGVVPENADRLSSEEDASEKQLAEILATGKSLYTEQFIAPYAQSKYLAEQFLLFELNAPFPILVVRPSNIGPSIQDPCALYGPEGAVPLHTFLQLLFTASGQRTFEHLDSALPRHLILDEVPVDLVANTCLLHLASGSTGIVHAGSQLYRPITFGEYVNQIRCYTPRSLLEKASRVRMKTSTHFAEKSNDMREHIYRDWQIDCARSIPLKLTGGPIGLDLSGHNFDSFAQSRISRRCREMESWIDSLESTAG
jgi:fatty acyl-CoA reductase